MQTKEDILPQTGPTMKQVYDAHFERSRSHNDPRREIGQRGAANEPDLEGYSRDSHNEIDKQFQRLPNPDLVLYIFPHLSEQGNPVPGYSTVLPMYDRVEYAMPGEAEGW